MIRIKRPPVAPATLGSDKVKKARRKIETIVEDGRSPRSGDFLPHWGNPDVRQALWEMQNGKCCYCERKRDVNRESDIEHFRPKADVHEAAEDHPGYWWLAYEWENLFFSCRHCNQEYKKCHFPVLDERDRARTPGDDLVKERACLVHPEDDEVEKLFGYNWGKGASLSEDLWLVFIHGNEISERGHITKDLLGLNRNELTEERGQLIPQLDGIATKMKAGKYLANELLIADAAKDIERETSADKPFAGFRRAYFRLFGMGEYVAGS